MKTDLDCIGLELAASFSKSARESAGLSQRELAQAVGTSQSRISEIESARGTRGPTIDLLARIASACGKTLTIGFK